MFEKIFIEVLNMSYIGSIVILTVLIARLLLKKVPKRYTYILWSVVLLRLVIPFSFDSVLSLLPVNLAETEKKHIVLHEQTHIRRFDHVIRFASYFVLCIHWFNPLVWAAFYVSGKDMEMACDESVINQLGYEIKKDYSQSLLNLATGKQNLRMSPLAFGEGDTKGRIRNILNLKKPKFYVVAAAGIILAVMMVGLITNPSDNSAWLTENEIVDTFAAHDLALAKDRNKNPADYAIGGIEPGIFRFKDYEGTLYIYIFDSLNERDAKTNLWEFDESDKVEFDGSVTTYDSKNAFIFLEAPFGNGVILDSNVYTEFAKLDAFISDTVFRYLNEGKTVVYNGESEHWSGTYTLKYYNNPIMDENGKLHMDSYNWNTYQLAYLGDDLENVGDLSVEYNRTGNGGEGTGYRLNDEGIVNLGGGGGGGANPPQEVTMTVMWNGQEESFVLKP